MPKQHTSREGVHICNELFLLCAFGLSILVHQEGCSEVQGIAGCKHRHQLQLLTAVVQHCNFSPLCWPKLLPLRTIPGCNGYCSLHATLTVSRCIHSCTSMQQLASQLPKSSKAASITDVTADAQGHDEGESKCTSDTYNWKTCQH